MDSSHPYIGAGLLILFIIIDAVVYCFLAAVNNINESQIDKENDEEHKHYDKLIKIIDAPEKFMNTLEVIVFITNVISGAYIISVLSQAITDVTTISQTWIRIATGVVMLILLLVFGVMFPKVLGKRKPEKYAKRLFGSVNILINVFRPITAFVCGFTHILFKIVGIDSYAETENVTEEEIIDMVNEGHEQGVLEAKEAEMITNIFELGEKEAQDIMTHRSAIEAIDGHDTLENVVHSLLNGQFSRYPVYDEDIDNIIGTLHIRDAIIAYEKMDYRTKPVMELTDVLRDAYFIPETRYIDDLLKEMQEEKIHLGIVVDEYGQTSGVISMEDIIEEIVGNILDEYDEDEKMIEQKSDDTYEVDGLMELDELEDILSIEFPDREYETLNGFLTSKLDRIPEDNEHAEIEYEGYMFKILEVANKVVRKVSIRKIDKQEEEDITDGKDN